MKTDKAKEKRKRRKTKCDKPCVGGDLLKEIFTEGFLNIYVYDSQLTVSFRLSRGTQFLTLAINLWTSQALNTLIKYSNTSGTEFGEHLKTFSHLIVLTHNRYLLSLRFNSHRIYFNWKEKLIVLGFQLVEASAPRWCRAEWNRFDPGIFLILFISIVHLVHYQFALLICILVLRTRSLVHRSRKINRRYNFIK